MSGRRGAVGSGSRLPSGHCWTRRVASGSFALKRLFHQSGAYPIRGQDKKAGDAGRKLLQQCRMEERACGKACHLSDSVVNASPLDDHLDRRANFLRPLA